MKMKLVEVKDIDGESGQKYTFTFKPTQEDLKNNVKLSVSCSDPFAAMGALELPQSKGDIILLETISKNEQTKLTEKKAKKDA